MKYAEIDKDFNVHLQFEVDGELVVPSSATYTVKKNDGTVVSSLEDQAITLTPNTSEVTIPIPAAANAVTLDSEIRFIEYSYTYDSINYKKTTFYQLRSSVNVPVDPTSVVLELGLSLDSYTINQVDLIRALEEVETDTETAVEAAITGGTSNLKYALELIKTKAAINLAENLELQIFQSEQGDNTLYRRFEEVDFNGIRERLAKKYSNLIDKIESADPVVPVLSLVSVGDDPVTGGA